MSLVLTHPSDSLDLLFAARVLDVELLFSLL